MRPQKSDGGRINCPVRDAIYALGIGSDLASLTGAKSAGVIGARQLRRIRHPHGSDSTSEPTPPKGGSDDPLRGSFARTRFSTKNADMKSEANFLSSIRHVTYNKGRNTPGIDDDVAVNPKQRLGILERLRSLMVDYDPLPSRRIYVEKPDGRQRPIGIPTVFDRVIQSDFCVRKNPSVGFLPREGRKNPSAYYGALALCEALSRNSRSRSRIPSA